MTPPNEHTKTLDPCPPEEFLQAYAAGKIKDKSLQSVILSHLEFCPSCEQQVRELKRAMSSGSDPIARRAQALQELQLAHQKAVKQGPTPGTIWRAVPESEKDPFGPLVLVIDTQEAKGEMSLTVAEVSEDIDQAIHTDIVLESKKSGLRFRCMVRTENVFTTTPDRLTLFAGALSPALMNKVSDFCKEAAHFDENIPLSQFVFLKDSQGTELIRRRGITSGMLLTKDDDARIPLLDESKQRCAYLTLAAMKSQSDMRQKVIRFKNRKWLVQRILPLAAVLALVVVSVKTLTYRTPDKPASILGHGIASNPVAARIPTRYLSSPAQTKDLYVFMDSRRDADPQASMELLKRNIGSIKAQPLYFFRPQKKVFSGLELALFPVKDLASDSGRSVMWQCDSLLIPLWRSDDTIVYQLSTPSMISIALNQGQASLETSLTKSFVTWVMRYLQGDFDQPFGDWPRGSVEDFEKAHKDQYSGIITWLKALGITFSDRQDWNVAMAEIIARYPNEAASTKGRWDNGELKAGRRSLPRVVLLTRLTMEAFPELEDDNKFKDFPEVPASYRAAHSKLKNALTNAFGSSYESLKASAEQDALYEVSETLSRNYKLKNMLTESEDWPWEDVANWVTFREP